MRPRKMKRLVSTASAGLVLAGAGVGMAARAEALPPNCISQPWGFLGSQVRQLCDGPIRPDGSWMRNRIIGVPSHTAPASSSCSGGVYSSYCTFYPGGYVAERQVDNETYPVTPDTVLPDEPGHIG